MLLHGLLLLLYGLLLSLELILSGLNLCKDNCGLLGLVSLILPHPLKNSKERGVCLRCLWSCAGTTDLTVMSSRRHPRDILIIIICTVTGVALDHTLLLSI